MTDFRFYGNADCMRCSYDFCSRCDVFFVGTGRRVYHNRCKAEPDRLHAAFKTVAVIEMYAYGNFCFFRKVQHDLRSVFHTQKLRMNGRILQNDRHIRLFRRSDNRSSGFPVRNVEGADRNFIAFGDFHNIMQRYKHTTPIILKLIISVCFCCG